MTTQNIDQRLSTIEEILFQLTQKKSNIFQRCWTWITPYIVPFVFGMIVGGIAVFCALQGKAANTTLEHQAALGGAAIPFRSEFPLPSPATLPPGNSIAGSTACSLTSTCEVPLPPSLQADNGRATSTRFYRSPIRRMR